MKQIGMAVIALLLCVSFAAQSTAADKVVKISLADARSRIDKAIGNAAVMNAIVQHLSAADQKQFLADVNKAISEMPASAEEKTAKFLNANSAAFRAAAPGNLGALVAEMAATVPPESLSVLCERYAEDLFNRASDSRRTFTDEQYTKISTDLMKVVNARTAETDNGSPRSAFIAVMMIKASNGTPADLGNSLVETLAEDARELARTEWLPAALGTDGRPQSYEPLLASADAGRRPDLEFSLVVAGPQFHESLLVDLSGKSSDQMAFSNNSTPVVDAVESILTHQVPVLGGGIGVAGGDVVEPQGYPFQTSGGGMMSGGF